MSARSHRRAGALTAGLLTLLVVLPLLPPAIWPALRDFITDPGAAIASAPSWAAGVLLAFGTLLSEDATALLAGTLLHQGRIDATTAIVGTGLGIWLGDLLLFGLGRAGGAWLARPVPGLARLGASWRGWTWSGFLLILVSRMVPGMRLPLYAAIGLAGGAWLPFVLLTGLMVALWTPLTVLAGGAVLVAVNRQLQIVGLPAWSAVLVALVGLIVSLRVLPSLATRDGRQRLVLAWGRWTRTEYWPTWLYYLPLAPCFVWWALRYRSCTVFAAANPGIVAGGLAGERKSDIQPLIPAPWAIPQLSVPPPGPERLALLQAACAVAGLLPPLILKPDMGQRGRGVRRCDDWAAVAAVLAETTTALVCQPWHPGPHEVGIYYLRHPTAARGRIFSITRKEFPSVVGDGEHRLGQLVERHARHRYQSERFRERLGQRWDTVPAAGATVGLGYSGNHAQGACFRDGADWITPALEARVEAIAQAIPGFYAGRFDVRFRELDAFLRGEGLAIVELNGVAAESTNIYDPDWPAWRSWLVLARQWSAVWAIGAANAKRGAAVPSISELLAPVLGYYRDREQRAVGD